MPYFPDEIKAANKTARASGAVGARAIIPRLILQRYPTSLSILDYGAGKAALHTQTLRMHGYNVTAYDFGDNVVPGLHDPKALRRKYDLVFASNVLNVQVSPRMLTETLRELESVMRRDSVLLVNYPSSPRKIGLSPQEMLTYMRPWYTGSKVAGSSVAPVWELHRT